MDDEEDLCWEPQNIYQQDTRDNNGAISKLKTLQTIVPLSPDSEFI